MQNTANAQNGRVGHHAQQNNADELHLLDIVGGAGNQGRGGEFLNLGIGVADYRAEHLAAQIAANRSRHAGGDEADGDGHGHHQQREGQHLAAGVQQIAHLHIMGNALCVIFQRYQQHGLAGKAVGHALIQRGNGAGQLGLQHLPRTGGLCHGGKLGGHGVKVIGGGGHSVGRAGLLGSMLGGGHIQDNVRRGEGAFQLCHRGVRVRAQGAQAVSVRAGIPLLSKGGVLLAHQQLQRLQGGVADGVGHRAFNAALLDADINDFAGVVGQAQIAVGLHTQQRYHGKAGRPVPPQLFKYLYHCGGSPFCLEFACSRTSFSASMAAKKASFTAIIWASCSGVNRAITREK